jgi:phenylacetate-CoA ligase
LQHYRRLQLSQYDTPERIAANQWNAIRGLLDHAYATVPFYRRRFDDLHVKPSDFHGFADFTKLPVLTKTDLRSSAEELRSAAHNPNALLRKRTSGSTGVSVEVLVDDTSQQFKRACTLRSDEWSGWRLGEPIAMVWGNPEYLRRGWRGRVRNVLLERATYLDTLKMDEVALARFAQKLQKCRPTLMFGHAHSVYLFARYVLAAGLSRIRPHGIITTAMVLHHWQRKTIEETFGCPVTNRYGCEEVSLIACECERHEGLHVNADGVYVEIIRHGRVAAPGEAGSVIVTDLSNRAMPLLRYQVGDVAMWSERRCSCGRGLPLLERLEGREADYVVTESGELISGISLTENFALHVPGVAQLQIIQETAKQFIFRIVRGPDFGPTSLRRIAELVAERFGPEVQHECTFVDVIPQEPSGKYRFCISRVPNAFTQPTEATLS